MKKVLILLVCLTVFMSCKNNNKSASDASSTTQNEGSEIIKGDFVYFSNAAVLQTEKEVYGVILNEKMHELDKQAKAYKKEGTDMVPVEIKAIITPKPEGEEGWPFQIEITEIIKVSQPKAQDENIIKIKNINN